MRQCFERSLGFKIISSLNDGCISIICLIESSILLLSGRSTIDGIRFAVEPISIFGILWSLPWLALDNVSLEILLDMRGTLRRTEFSNKYSYTRREAIILTKLTFRNFIVGFTANSPSPTMRLSVCLTILAR